MPPMSDEARPCAEASPASEGRLLGARLLELGHLRGVCKEDLVIVEASPAAGGVAGGACAAAACGVSFWPSKSSTTAPAASQEQKAGCGAGLPVVEGDLAVEDFSMDEDWQDLCGGLPAIWAPGSQKGRTLMTERAKQCVICMEDKEHTLVPPHKHRHSNVDSHRVCTECWDEFLHHRAEQHWQKQAAGRSLPLVCPVCRTEIEVPDVWGVQQELPTEWVKPCAPCTDRYTVDVVELPCEASRQCWADAASATSGPRGPTEAPKLKRRLTACLLRPLRRTLLALVR